MPQNMDFSMHNEDYKVLRRRNDKNLQLSLFEETYGKNYNNLKNWLGIR
ncbi:MAG: hypothetical protein GDA46_01590 [Bdellovibrionales bacterium]|nr:hypothetical protein [Bdellovibrionales bacterium]